MFKNLLISHHPLHLSKNYLEMVPNNETEYVKKTRYTIEEAVTTMKNQLRIAADMFLHSNETLTEQIYQGFSNLHLNPLASISSSSVYDERFINYDISNDKICAVFDTHYVYDTIVERIECKVKKIIDRMKWSYILDENPNEEVKKTFQEIWADQINRFSYLLTFTLDRVGFLVQNVFIDIEEQNQRLTVRIEIVNKLFHEDCQ